MILPLVVCPTQSICIWLREIVLRGKLDLDIIFPVSPGKCVLFCSIYPSIPLSDCLATHTHAPIGFTTTVWPIKLLTQANCGQIVNSPVHRFSRQRITKRFTLRSVIHAHIQLLVVVSYIVPTAAHLGHADIHTQEPPSPLTITCRQGG